MRIEMLTPARSAGEAAAVVAALEQFVAETTPTSEPEQPRGSAWQRAALEEGVEGRQVSGYAWGHAPRPR